MKKIENFKNFSESSKIEEFKESIINDIIDVLSDISSESKDILYISGEDSILERISKETGIRKAEFGMNYSDIDISDFIYSTLEIREDKLFRSARISYGIELPEVKDELLVKLSKMEEDMIPKSGPAKTNIGEILRAIRWIQWRALNDGDSPHDILNPTFISYLYLINQISEINRKSDNFKFSDELSQYEEIICECDDKLCKTLNITRYLLTDLYSKGILDVERNYINSRNFETI